MIALEERNKALAEEAQALEFEVKDKDKELKKYKEPYDTWIEIANSAGYLDNIPQTGRCEAGRVYRIIIVEELR